MKKALVAAVAALLALPGMVRAQDYPTRPITMIIPFAAGGPTDVLGRVVAARMSEILGQQIVIENATGAGGMTGANRVKTAPPDGYQILLGTVGTQAQVQNLSRKPLYDAGKDFQPVALLAEVPLVLIVRKDLPVSTFEEFVAYAKANRGKMNYGSAGAGSATHLGCVLLDQAIGADAQHVPYKGTGPAMADLQAGRIDFLCEIVVSAVPQVQAGTVRALATLSRDRSPVLPDLPTAYEKGFQNIQAYTWTALMFPKGTPAPIVVKMRDATLATLAEPEVRRQLQTLGASIVSSDRTTPEYLGKFVQNEIDKWAGPIRDSGAVIQ